MKQYCMALMKEGTNIVDAIVTSDAPITHNVVVPVTDKTDCQFFEVETASETLVRARALQLCLECDEHGVKPHSHNGEGVSVHAKGQRKKLR